MRAAEIPSRQVRPLDDRERRGADPGPVGRPIDPPPRVVAGFKIETGIPVPVTTRKNPIIDALAALQPGESVFQKGKSTQIVPIGIKKLFPQRFYIARKVEGGVRIWRKN